MHPHMALKKKHWDGVNYRHGNNCEWRKWKQVEDRDPADTAVYYERLKAFIQAVKVVPREQLGSFKDVPTIEFMNISNSWVHTKEFKDEYLSERLRLQLWTLRIE